MTTIIAVRKNGRTCIVADSLYTYGERRKEGYNLLASSQKLFLCNSVIVGFSGAKTWGRCLKEFLVSSANDVESCNKEALRNIFLNFWESLREKHSIVPFPDKRFTSFSPCQIVIASSKRLFEITTEGCVIENENIVTIGNGRPFSYGAIKSLEPFTQDPYELAIAGIKAAAAWDPTTLEPFFWMEYLSVWEVHKIHTHNIK